VDHQMCRPYFQISDMPEKFNMLKLFIVFSCGISAKEKTHFCGKINKRACHIKFFKVILIFAINFGA
jgi:hypothetical protein